MHWEKWTEERKGKEVGEGGEFGENIYGKKWTEEREGMKGDKKGKGEKRDARNARRIWERMEIKILT